MSVDLEFEELDTLLEESMKAAAVRRAAKQGRRLTGGDADLLEAIKIAEELQTWNEIAVIAVIEHRMCSCGCKQNVFLGHYKIMRPKRAKFGVSRTVKISLVELDGLKHLPHYKHTVRQVTMECAQCVDQLPNVVLEDFPELGVF